MRRASILATVVATLFLLGCTDPGPEPPTDRVTDAPSEVVSTPTETPSAPPTAPPNPPVVYDPAWPEQTVTTSSGYLVNECVPEELRDNATTLTTTDGVHLSALVLGSGSEGVLLAHEQGYRICSFLDIGQELAGDGYLVVIPEYREHGASQTAVDPEPIELDAEAALVELRRQGAEQVFLAGASCGGTTAMTEGVRFGLPISGLLILSAPAQCGHLDATPAVAQITAPSLFVVSPGDMDGAMEDQVRELYDESGAPRKRLIIDESGLHGTEMYHSGEDGAGLRAEILAFIESTREQAHN